MESPKTQNKKTQKGFTLIELSIVLVIIGLIVGGILVGQDLIKAAEIRATVGQVEKYNSAVNTFRTKYNALPGDIVSAQAVAFGLFAETTLAGTAGHMDGNGLIEGGGAGATVGLGETLEFWRHLSDANLVDGSLGSNATDSLIVQTTGAVTATVNSPSRSFPPTKTTPTNSFIVYSNLGINYFQILPVATIPATGIYTYSSVGLTPIQAYNMDIKLDDGLPQTGIVQARAITNVNGAATSAAASTANTCDLGSGAATDTYNRVPATGGNDGSCSLRFRFN